ncbi:MAG: hypothetical protein ACXWT0_16580, partial [Methylobacter sp.]
IKQTEINSIWLVFILSGYANLNFDPWHESLLTALQVISQILIKNNMLFFLQLDRLPGLAFCLNVAFCNMPVQNPALCQLFIN